MSNTAPGHTRSFSLSLRYGMPLFLEDRTGSLVASDFIDLNNRMSLSYQPCPRDPSDPEAPYVYTIYDQSTSDGGLVATLQFGANNELGTIMYRDGETMDMNTYISQVNEIAGSKLRRFFASDGNEYRWGYRMVPNTEWAATKSDGEVVAEYSLKIPEEPEYRGSSGCMLSVEEEFGYLTYEMLATVMIMRHIDRYNL